MGDYQFKLEKHIQKKQWMDSELLKNIIELIYKDINSSTFLNLVLEYLKIYPQQISCISKKLFDYLLSTKEKTLHPLIFFLASRHDDIDYDLNLVNLPVEKWTYLLSSFYQRLPLMICDPELVENVKNQVDTYKMLIDCPQWFTENSDFFMGLHLIEFDENECDELFTKLKADWSIFPVTKEAISFVDLVAAKCDKEIEYVQFLISALFSLPPKNDDITWLSSQIINNLKLLETNCPIHISDWEALIIKSVKFGLIDINPEYGFIKVFRKLIKKADVDKSIVKKSFELLAGYSQFSNIMMSRDTKQLQKEEVLRLIQTLVKKEPSIMAVSHVPLYLCSYNASLSITDQILLKILFLYEDNSIPMSNYRPYLWGSFAVSHYQVKSHLISKTLSSFPSTTEVLSYVPLKRIKETISCFPIDRVLSVKNQTNVIYNTCRSKDPSLMFDPAFFLPMISSLLATEAPLSIEKFNRNGCLSMVLACLGSCDSQMRSAAYHVLTLLRSHLFCRRAENLLWEHFISWVAYGIQNLQKEPPPQLPMIQALFLSRMVLAIANHEKGIETTCCKILLARPDVRLNHIPEFITFLTTFTDWPKDKSIHMRWFFKIIRDGIRSKNDWSIMKFMDLLNMFSVVFSCSKKKDRILILEMMDNLFRIVPATGGGTGPWAISLMTIVTKDPSNVSLEEIKLLFQCLHSLSGSSYISIPVIDFWLYLFLAYGCDPNVCSFGFAVLDNIISKYNVYKFLNDNLYDIFYCAKNSGVFSDDEEFKCKSILEHGINGIKIEETSSFLFLPTMVKILKAQ